jgi:proton glutamate symport protein
MPGLHGTVRKRLWVAGGSFAALVLGLLLGIWSHRRGATVAPDGLLSTIGTLWINALRMTIVPLVGAQLVATFAMAGSAGRVAKLSGLASVVFAAMLVIGGAVTVLTTPLLLSQVEFSAEGLAAFRALPASAELPPAVAGSGSWLTGLIPSNVFQAAAQEHLLGVMIFAIAFGLAVGQLASERRQPVTELARTIADAMMTIIGWLMWVMPAAVFALALSSASRGGIGAAEVVATFVALVCAILVCWTLLQYAIAVIGGGVPLRRLAAALFPAQLVALSTRSSIAALPTLLDGAQHRLRLRPEVSNLVLPLAVSTFKFNRPITASFQFLFLAHVYGIALSTPQIVAFLAAAILLSVTTLGIPSGGSRMRSAPLYIAAGIPIEGYLFIEAVEVIPDLFKTVLNVTGHMTAATLVERMGTSRSPVDGPSEALSTPASSARLRQV